MDRTEMEQMIVNLLADFTLLYLAEELADHSLPATAALRANLALEDLIDRAKTETERRANLAVKRAEVSNVTRG